MSTTLFVQLALKEGYRSRAAYKLLEIDVRINCSSPAAWWCTWARRRAAGHRAAAAEGVRRKSDRAGSVACSTPWQGWISFRVTSAEEAVLGKLEGLLQGKPVGLVISDMAPHIGVAPADQARAMHLAELALEFALDPDDGVPGQGFSGAGSRNSTN